MSEHNDADQAHPPGNTHNQYSSASRWRHQESSRFARHAVQGGPRDPVSTGSTGELASFLNSSRVEGEGLEGAGHIPLEVNVGTEAGNEASQPGDAGAQAAPDGIDGKEIICGPLLNYSGIIEGRWHGSVLIVVKGGGSEEGLQPGLSLRRVQEAQSATADNKTNGAVSANDDDASQATQITGERLYSDERNTFWRFAIDVPLEAAEIQYQYHLPGWRIECKDKPQKNAFFIPSASESMRLMFHSCNGFSVGTDEEAYSGAPLWNDVMRKHTAAPFHAMLGGGDQIYNDGIRVNGPLRPWTDIGNPKKRREYPFSEQLRTECDDYYLKNYIRWYNTAPFSYANGQIAQINIWDDHDVGVQY